MADGGRGPLVAFLAMGACCAAPLLIASGVGAGIASGLAGAPWVWLLAGAGAVDRPWDPYPIRRCTPKLWVSSIPQVGRK